MSLPTSHAERRKRFCSQLEDAVVFMHTSPLIIRGRDLETRYRPDSYFYYLSGLDEPDSALVLLPGEDKEFILYVRPRNPAEELWTGERAGLEGAKSTFQADDSRPIEEFQKDMAKFIRKKSFVYYGFGFYQELDQQFFQIVSKYRPNLRSGDKLLQAIKNPWIALDEMRLVKDAGEIELTKKACDVTKNAYLEMFQAVCPGKYEYEIEALLESSYRRQGGVGAAYPSIVGGGNNATVLHYNSNKNQLQDGQLLLIDSGSEYAYYASDVTRTLPVSGKFSDPQREIYNIVLEAQKNVVAAVKPGVRNKELYELTVKILYDGMVDSGLLKGSLDGEARLEAVKPFFPHLTGHWLGLDVHDAGGYFESDGSSKVLQENMLLTVEPGLYFPESDTRVPEAYRGIGVRIEDNILVTKEGHQNLTQGIPKEVDDIEKVMRG